MLNWLVHDRGIEPHIPVFDKSQRTDGTFSRDDSQPGELPTRASMTGLRYNPASIGFRTRR